MVVRLPAIEFAAGTWERQQVQRSAQSLEILRRPSGFTGPADLRPHRSIASSRITSKSLLLLMEIETAHGMLAWPHSGFHVHDGVWVAADEREFALRGRYAETNVLLGVFPIYN